MLFELKFASEIVQKRNEETFGDLQAIHNNTDDIIIADKNEHEHRHELDSILLSVVTIDIYHTINSKRIQHHRSP